MTLHNLPETSKDLQVIQSNWLIESSYYLTTLEGRLVQLMISLISKNDDDFKTYSVRINDLPPLLNIDKKTIYREIRKISKTLLSRVISVKNENGKETFFHWVDIIEIDPNTGLLTFHFHPNLKPFLLYLQGQFTTFPLSVVIAFKGSYTRRIYELMKDQLYRSDTREITVEELRYKLAIKDSSYRQFKDLNRAVLKKSQDEINKHSDIHITYEPVKSGRFITALIFKIKRQPYQETLPFLEPLPEDKIDRNIEATEALMMHGISQKDAKVFVEGQGAEAIARTLEIFEERKQKKKIKGDGAAYLATLLRKEAGIESETFKKKKIEAAKAAQTEVEQLEKQKQETEATEKAKTKVLRKRREELQALLAAKPKKEQAQILADFEASLMQIERENYKKRGLKSVMVQSRYYAFLEKEFL